MEKEYFLSCLQPSRVKGEKSHGEKSYGEKGGGGENFVRVMHRTSDVPKVCKLCNSLESIRLDSVSANKLP